MKVYGLLSKTIGEINQEDGVVWFEAKKGYFYTASRLEKIAAQMRKLE